MIGELKGRLGSFTKALEMFYLINDVKPVCRFGFYEKDIAKVKKVCSDYSLKMAVSNFKVLLDSGSSINDFNNKGYKTSLQNPFPGMVFTYISKDAELSDLAKYLENSNNVYRLGELLGYPWCCIEFFIKNSDMQALKNNDFVLPALKNSDGFRFPKELNIAARYFDLGIVPFFPHSFGCSKALKLAKGYFATIAEHEPSVAADIARKLSCGIIYTEDFGVYLLLNPRLKGEYLNFDAAVSGSEGRLLDELNTYCRVNILDRNNVILGPHLLKDVGVMVFE